VAYVEVRPAALSVQIERILSARETSVACIVQARRDVDRFSVGVVGAENQAMLKAMLDAFDFQVVGEETVNGHSCWVLDAKNKPSYQPTNRETKVLTGMKGKLWIDQGQYQWVRVKAEVIKPVNFYGFFAKVGPGTNFVLEQEPVTDNIWLPKRFSMRVKASALGMINENSSDDETYADYKPIVKAATAAK